MILSRSTALSLMVLLLTMLMLGTQMPGEWRDAVLRVAHLPWVMTKIGHIVLFASIACLARVAPLRQPVARLLLSALALALLTEGLQFFALNRDPSWYDVGIDMFGATVGLLFVLVQQAFLAIKRRF